MSDTQVTVAEPPSEERRAQFLGHPVGLFLLFLVEMWERFSYYGMRGLLVLYLTSPTTGMRVLPPGREAGFNPGRGWEDSVANTAYGWYTGLCYLTPIAGGMIADKLIGTHRSMVVGGLLIALGHIMLGVSGLGEMAQNSLGMGLFVFGLGLIIIGTGHFKPCVSVMVGQLYRQGDPRRETAFGIFYMGINLGAAIQTYIVGTLGERVGWHWGFGAAAVGMLAGLTLYLFVRPFLLQGIGLPRGNKGGVAVVLLPLGVVLAAVGAVLFHLGVLRQIDAFVSQTWVIILIAGAALAWASWFVARQRPEDRGPVASIFIFMLFNAVFWLSFEQAGSSINLFTDRDTDRTILLPQGLQRLGAEQGYPAHWAVWSVLGLLLAGVSGWTIARGVHTARVRRQFWGLMGVLAGLLIFALGVLKWQGGLEWVQGFTLVPTTWFQSVNPWLIIIFAPITGVMWTALSRRKANPTQPYKISIGLLGVGLGYVFMVMAAMQAKDGAKANMMLIVGTYFVHTMGEIVLSPTGLSYVTKAAPREHTSLLMGVWFISSFIANLGAGKVAALVEPIINGEKRLPWHLAGEGPNGANTYADFFFLFVITSCGAGLIILVFGPLLKKLTGGRDV
jgi:POT family proton-dependent oligopeptide transporter